MLRRRADAGRAPDRADRWEAQRSFDELGRPLRELTFCVVDLETTGGSAEGGSMITEIGAVKVRGGEVLGEFQTLVNPHTQIPPFIAVLTGITNSMVSTAPPIESVLPSFLEFAAGSVLVAHNAPFDVGSPATTRPTASSPRWRASSTRRRPPTTGHCPTRAPPSTCSTG